MANNRKDADWLRRSFLVKKTELTDSDYRNRTFTSASLKYTDTTPGGNLCINPPPQFTRFADIKATGPFAKSKGMGRYYSEAFDDNNQIIHMRMGVEQYNSMTSFFTGFYNSSAGQLARTGRAEGAFYLIGKAAGYVIQLASWQLLAIHFLGAGFKFLADKKPSKFYYSKPTMALYWNAVQTMVNHLAVNRGIVPRVMNSPGSEKLNNGYQFDAQGLSALHNQAPDIFDTNGQIDVYAMANKAKRMERKRMVKIKEVLDNAGELSINDTSALIRSIYDSELQDNKPSTLGSYMSKWWNTSQSKQKAGSNESSNTTETLETNQSDVSKLIEFLNAEADDGSQFASFRVNATGPVSAQFSNQAGESEIQSKINGISSQARSANFSFANGNLIGGPLGAAVGAVVKSVKDFTTGVLDSVELTGLATLAGAAFVDIPQHWKSSAATLPRSTYTMNLVSAYGNPISQMLNLDIPLAMILAAGLPKSTGKQSYVGPFLIELYDRGRCQTRLGMIDSIQITHGTGNIGFNQDGKALGIDVTFSVLDMSSIMHMPITENFTAFDAGIIAAGSAIGGSTGATAAAALTGGGFDDDTVYSDYLATLAGMSLGDQIYTFRKLKLNLTRKLAAYNSWTNVSHMASFLGDTFPFRMASAFYRGTDKK